MVRFFFDFDEDDRYARDTEGMMLKDVAHARREAVIALSQLLMFKTPAVEHCHIKCHIRVDGGARVHTASLQLRES